MLLMQVILEDLAEQRQTYYGYEAAVAGGIPIINVLRGIIPTTEIFRVSGILNGTTNYILTEMKERDEFCTDCQSRLEKNPLRILDCKKDAKHPLMGTAPSILEYLNEESSQYFEQVKAYLDAIELPYEVDPTLVRGLDYYNHTAFELMAEGDGFGAITTLCGGGRYNGLVESLGGPSTPGIGFAFSIERLIMALKGQNQLPNVTNQIDCYFIKML